MVFTRGAVKADPRRNRVRAAVRTPSYPHRQNAPWSGASVPGAPHTGSGTSRRRHRRPLGVANGAVSGAQSFYQVGRRWKTRRPGWSPTAKPLVGRAPLHVSQVGRSGKTHLTRCVPLPNPLRPRIGSCPRKREQSDFFGFRRLLRWLFADLPRFVFGAEEAGNKCVYCVRQDSARFIQNRAPLTHWHRPTPTH